MRSKVSKFVGLAIIIFSSFAFGYNNTYAENSEMSYQLDPETSSQMRELIRQSNEINTQIALLREKGNNLQLQTEIIASNYLWSNGVKHSNSQNWVLSTDPKTGEISLTKGMDPQKWGMPGTGDEGTEPKTDESGEE